MSEIKYPKLLWMDSRAEDSQGYTYALNGVSINEESKGFVSNEVGNTLAFNTGRLGVEYIPIGFIPLVENSGVLFSVREDEVRSEIGLVVNSVYTTLISSNDLGFTLSEQVQGTVTNVNGCERVVVFRAPKIWAINIDNITQYLIAGETQESANLTGDGWDTDLMKLFLNYDRPTFASIEVNDTGGSLPLGTYEVVANYLDSDLNESGWMDISLPIPVTDESFSGVFDAVDGGFNSIVPPTNKSIAVSFANVDTSFSYLRIALIASNDGVRTAYKIVDYPITSDTLYYTIGSIVGDEISTIPLADISVDKIIYEECQTITQIRGRLVPANVKEKQIDFTAFQNMANNIKVNWFKQEVQAESPDGFKSPTYYLDTRGFMSNEVYSLAIVPLFKDNYEGPAFHIPGREQDYGFGGDLLPSNYEPNIWHNRPLPTTGWDSTLLVVDTDIALEDVQHLGFSSSIDDIGYGIGLVPRWLACNTAIKFEAGGRNVYSDGEMAYWESTLDYPNTVDCDNARIFPEGKIRHHKTPDVTLTPHALYNSDDNRYYVYPLGLKLTNIEIPAQYADEVIGYKIVREIRTSQNTSVFDKGLITTCMYDETDEELFQPYPYNSHRSVNVTKYVDNSYSIMHTPRTKFQREATGGTHIKVDQKLITAPFTGGEYLDYYSTGPVEYRSNSRFTVGEEDSALIAPAYPAVGNVLNRAITTQGYVDADTLLDGFFDYNFNNTEQQEAYVVKTTSNMPFPDYTVVTGQYINLLGDVETNPVYFFYGGIEKYLPQQYGQISSGAYISCSSSYLSGTSADIFGGDCFISKLYFKRHARIEGGRPVNDDAASTDFIESHMVSFYVESPINCGYRNEGTEDFEAYYPKSYVSDLDSFLDFERTINGTIDSDLIPNYYAYNTDFSRENDVKLYFTLTAAYDYCSACQGEFKTRIPWSEVKNNETNLNPWRNFRANNYTDLPEDKGEIINIFVDDYKFFAQTLGALFNIPVGYQEIKTTENSAFLGTGEFMSLGGQELKSLKEGYLGSRSQWATCTTEVGTFIVSYDRVFLLNQGSLVEISKNGLSNFFEQNKIYFYDDFYNKVGIDFPLKDNPANPNGIGFISCRDSKNKRWVLTKKDYRILFECGGIIGEDKVHVVDTIYWDSDDNQFKICTVGGSIFVAEFEAILFSDTDYFQNKSYTISFDMDLNGWVSFHSYLPNFLFNTSNKWYSYKDSGVYEHNLGDFQTYYGDKYSYVIEQPIIQNFIQSNITNTIQFVTHATNYDSTYEVWKHVPLSTFDKIWIYNDYQSTGVLDMIVADNNDPFQSIAYNAGEILANKSDKFWNINGHFNYVTAQPFYSKSWDDIKADYFTDKTPVNTSYVLSQTELERFRDGYVNCRFIYENPDNNRLLFKYLRTYDIPSIR